MEKMIEAILFYLFLIDAIFANICLIFFKEKFNKKFHKILPLTPVWTILYLLVVLWLGFTLFRLGLI